MNFKNYLEVWENNIVKDELYIKREGLKTQDEWNKLDRIVIGKGIKIKGNAYYKLSETEMVKTRTAWERMGRKIIIDATPIIKRIDNIIPVKMWELYKESDTEYIYNSDYEENNEHNI